MKGDEAEGTPSISHRSFDEAVSRVKAGLCDCAVVNDGGSREGRGRGLYPLVQLYDADPAFFRGARLADKIVGRAAAFIAIDGGVSFVYGEVMSEGAAQLLDKHGIGHSCGLMIGAIVNRTGDGPCPLENAVRGIDDVGDAVVAIRHRLAELRVRPPHQ